MVAQLGGVQMASQAEVDAVDAFMAESKQLSGSPPEFGPSSFVKNGRAEMTAVWPIADVVGVVGAGQLRIVSRAGDAEALTISVVYAKQCVARVDFVPVTTCEANPLWAARAGLPPSVCGPHFHAWEHNRRHVLESGWTLPAREQLPVQVRRFDQVFPWLADRINLTLTPEQRQFEIPKGLM